MAYADVVSLGTSPPPTVRRLASSRESQWEGSVPSSARVVDAALTARGMKGSYGGVDMADQSPMAVNPLPCQPMTVAAIPRSAIPARQQTSGYPQDLLQGNRLIQERRLTRQEMITSGLLSEEDNVAPWIRGAAVPVQRGESDLLVESAATIVEGPRVCVQAVASQTRVLQSRPANGTQLDESKEAPVAALLSTTQETNFSAGAEASELVRVLRRNAELEAELFQAWSRVQDLQVQLQWEAGEVARLQQDLDASEAVNRASFSVASVRAKSGSALQLSPQHVLSSELEQQLEHISSACDHLQRAVLPVDHVEARMHYRQPANGSSSADEELRWLQGQLLEAQAERAALVDHAAKLESELQAAQALAAASLAASQQMAVDFEAIKPASVAIAPAAVEEDTGSLDDLNAVLKRELQDVVASRDACKTELAWERSEMQRLKERLAVAEAKLGDDVPIVSRKSSMRKQLTRQLSLQTSDELFAAAASGDVALLQAALAQADKPAEVVLKARDEDGRNLLHVAIASGKGSQNEEAEFLIKEGQKWATGRKFIHSLQGAMLERDIETFVCGEDSKGRSPLGVLCMRPDGGPDVAISLIEAHADPLQRDARGMTPFLECACADNANIMKLLLQLSRGQVLLDADDDFRSAIHWAAASGSWNAMELLLRAKADAEATDSDGKTPLQLAEDAGHSSMATMMLQQKDLASDDDEYGGDVLEEVFEDAFPNHSEAADVQEMDSDVDEDGFEEILRRQAMPADVPEFDPGLLGTEVTF